MAGAQDSLLTFFVNGKKVTERDVDPETMLLPYLRKRMGLTGSKYGCGGGGCGACTVMLSRYHVQNRTVSHCAVNACLMPVCQLQGVAVTTVEGIGNTKTKLHPVQERIAKAHGSQCGFCTPGMVMSMYALLRNKPQPCMEDITETLAGNLCRCTGYRPILDGYRTFCEVSDCCQSKGGACCLNGNSPEENGHLELFNKDNLLPLDPTQDLIFPPELIRMAERGEQVTQVFRGERVTWVSPVTLEEVVDLKAQHPQAPIVMGNTNIGLDMKFKGVLHPFIISPSRVADLFEVTHTPEGVSIGAGCTMSVLREVLEELVRTLAPEQSETHRALLQQLGNLAGAQIRNVATLGGNIASAYPNSDLNPVLAAANCMLTVVSKEERREIPINKDFFQGFGKTILQPQEIVLSVFIPVSKKGEFVRAFRQAPRKENALATVNAGMRIRFRPGSSVVEELSLFYGGVGPCTLAATKTCQQIIGRSWSEETLSAAYPVLLEELALPSSAPGGKVVFRRALTLTFLFKFYLQMQQILTEMGVMSEGVQQDMRSALTGLPSHFLPSYQDFQDVLVGQPGQDPVGRPMMHRSALSCATGEAVYCDDMPQQQGELSLTLVTSTKANAKIIDIDVSAALALPGVVDVITASDIPGKKFRTFCGLTEELLAEEEVTCVGQMVCAVLADTKAHSKRGAAAVKITYQDIPNLVLTVEEAIEQKSFFCPPREIGRGDVTEGFKMADHIHEGEIRIGGQEHFYMETQSMLVVPVGEEREMNVYLSTQHPSYAQDSIAETLNIPSNRVTCHVKRVGGAFGGKVTKTSIMACITAVAAWKTERPVRLVLERGEDMLITGGRHPVLAKYKVGYKNDGKITATDVNFYVNGGNTVDESPLVIEKILLHFDNAYNIPNFHGTSFACKTNLPSNTAFRGFGVPQCQLVTEHIISDVALKLGRTAEEIREMNMYRGPSMTHYKMPFDPENMLLCWEECKRRACLESRRMDIAQFNQHNRWKKRGIALVPIKYGVGFSEAFLNQAAALVNVFLDGSVLVSHGGAELGQGIHTKMQQVASRELRIPTSLIHISETNTHTVPNTCPSAASFGTDANGMAVKDACETLYSRLEPLRKKNPTGTWQSWIKDAFLEKISLSATGYYRGHDLYMDWEKQEGLPYAYFTYGACCCEVELDCLTGDYRTVRTDMVFDIGRSINPSIDIGQIEGAFMQGVGLYTSEEKMFSPSGVLYTRGPGQYKVPAVCDVPLKFNIYLLPGTQNPHAIYSSKGIGEPAVFLGCSVFFALKDAVVAARGDAGLSGPFTFHSPATAEKTCLACASHLTQMVPMNNPGTFQPWAIDTP
ncbi:aldehyde oxidase 6 isoform X2 [Engraulis encrasicolus]|uniref:aldehyde oxidase 6 isoform X2 n=1 Tax=Engraulis encrasicolus TaxID=184585 RepID=UPI002FCF53DB